MSSESVQVLQRLIGSGAVSVVKFCLEKSCCEPDVINQGVLTMELKKAEVAITVKCVGVRNIEFNSGAFDDVVIIGLVIEDMSSDQWPDVNVRVFSENDDTVLSFYCSRIYKI